MYTAAEALKKVRNKIKELGSFANLRLLPTEQQNDLVRVGYVRSLEIIDAELKELEPIDQELEEVRKKFPVGSRFQHLDYKTEIVKRVWRADNNICIEKLGGCSIFYDPQTVSPLPEIDQGGE